MFKCVRAANGFPSAWGTSGRSAGEHESRTQSIGHTVEIVQKKVTLTTGEIVDERTTTDERHLAQSSR